MGYELFRQLYAQREAIKSQTQTPRKNKRAKMDPVQEQKERHDLERKSIL